MSGGRPCSRRAARCLSEILGTYILVFAGPASVVVVSTTAFSAPEKLATVTLVFGVTAATMIVVFGKRSGANINPAASLASGLAGVLEWKLAIPYVGFQTVGGLLARALF